MKEALSRVSEVVHQIHSDHEIRDLLNYHVSYDSFFLLVPLCKTSPQFAVVTSTTLDIDGLETVVVFQVLIFKNQETGDENSVAFDGHQVWESKGRFTGDIDELTLIGDGEKTTLKELLMRYGR